MQCIEYVKAVNGAGESDHSNNASIPSLPDIRPVTDSLTHQVWKYNGEIRVNISFQVRMHFLCNYPKRRNIGDTLNLVIWQSSTKSPN